MLIKYIDCFKVVFYTFSFNDFLALRWDCDPNLLKIFRIFKR